MPHAVEFLRSAARELASLPKHRQRQLARSIDKLREDLFPSGVKKLEGEQRLYRLRAGDYRILYTVDDAHKTATIIKIGPRHNIYRNL
jgi:mRNA interferase RelE/StbE